VEIARVIPRGDPAYEPRLKRALEELRELALEEGAGRSAVISCEDLAFKEEGIGAGEVPDGERSIFWPVPLFPKDSLRDALRLYRWAVVFGLHVAGRGSRGDEGDPAADSAGRAHSLHDARERIFRIAGLVEAASFYKGFYLAVGLAAGNCKEVFCGTDERCQALSLGKPCKHPLRPRPSMQACGLEPGAVAAKAGWKDMDYENFVMGMVFVD